MHCIRERKIPVDCCEYKYLYDFVVHSAYYTLVLVLAPGSREDLFCISRTFRLETDIFPTTVLVPTRNIFHKILVLAF